MSGDWGFRGEANFDAALARLEVTAEAAASRAVMLGAFAVRERATHKLKAKSRTRDERTPAAPGEPPATVTGNLANSYKTEGPVPNGFASYMAATAPTAVYTRVQELGATIFAHGQRMRFRYGGDFYNVTQVTIPARPSLQPALHELRDDGTLIALYRNAWRTAQAEALG